MFKKFVCLFSSLFLTSLLSTAQQQCGTDEYYRDLVKKYPLLAQFEEQFNAQLADRFARKTSSTPDTATYDVPLVIHVVHDYGAEYLSDDVLYDAVKYWGVVFLAENADTANVIVPFKTYIGNPKIRLHLATIDPNGNPTKGIVHERSYLTSNADDQAKYNQWPQNKYINIWFIRKFGSGSTGAAAYALLPAYAAYVPEYDGIIGLYSYANYAKVIPHELGHVLNLSHTWGNTNNPAVACGDDGVDDTPPTLGHNPVGCTAGALYDTTCATGYLKKYKDIYGADSIVDYPDTANSQNIMDYTYCQEMFTKGQVDRMRKSITSSVAGRSNLISAANLAATGALDPMPDLPPIPDFVLYKAADVGLVTDPRTYFLTTDNPASFQFRNTSWNDTITDVSWTFSNGATLPTSTSAGYVINKFSQPGWVTVSLTARANSGSTTLVDDHAVYAADPVAVGGMGYFQEFATPDAYANWPMFNYFKNQFRWESYSGAGYGDNSCVRYRSYDTSQRIFGVATGDYDDFVTPAFDLSGVPDRVFLNFFTAGAYTSAGSSLGGMDSLQVQVSTNGGTVWTRLAGFSGNDLANNGNRGTEFIPISSGQWKARGVAVPAEYRTSGTFFRFHYYPGAEGNDLYLDKVYLYAFPAGVKETYDTNGSFSIFPNPSANGTSMVFKTGADGRVAYSVKDVTGKLVYTTEKTMSPNTMQQEELSRDIVPSAGIYFVTLTIDGMNSTRKLVVY